MERVDKQNRGAARLEEVLKNDKRRIEGRDEAPPLTVGVPFYPDENEEVLRSRFDRFVVTGDDNSPVVAVVGIREGNEQTLYRIELDSRPLALMFFMSIRELFNSNLTVNNLRDILQKTEVPIIKESPDVREGTPNIWKNITSEFDDDPVNYGGDIIALDNRAAEQKAQIDAKVFELYNIT